MRSSRASTIRFNSGVAFTVWFCTPISNVSFSRYFMMVCWVSSGKTNMYRLKINMKVLDEFRKNQFWFSSKEVKSKAAVVFGWIRKQRFLIVAIGNMQWRKNVVRMIIIIPQFLLMGARLIGLSRLGTHSHSGV